MDKDAVKIHEEEINKLKSEINYNKTKIAHQTSLLTQLNNKMITITKQVAKSHGQGGLNAADLQKMNLEVERLQQFNRDEDLLSDFSVITDDTEATGIMDNSLDLYINKAKFDRQHLARILGNKEILPSAVQTFITVGFYDHIYRPTQIAEGFEPKYKTQFSFKNLVDNFYIQYLESNNAKMEIFINRA